MPAALYRNQMKSHRLHTVKRCYDNTMFEIAWPLIFSKEGQGVLKPSNSNLIHLAHPTQRRRVRAERRGTIGSVEHDGDEGRGVLNARPQALGNQTRLMHPLDLRCHNLTLVLRGGKNNLGKLLGPSHRLALHQDTMRRSDLL